MSKFLCHSTSIAHFVSRGQWFIIFTSALHVIMWFLLLLLMLRIVLYLGEKLIYQVQDMIPLQQQRKLYQEKIEIRHTGNLNKIKRNKVDRTCNSLCYLQILINLPLIFPSLLLPSISLLHLLNMPLDSSIPHFHETKVHQDLSMGDTPQPGLPPSSS